MFEQSLIESADAIGRRKPAVFAASVGGQLAVLAALALLPLTYYAALPAAPDVSMLEVPALPPAPAAVAAPQPSRAFHALRAWAPPLAAPLVAPAMIPALPAARPAPPPAFGTATFGDMQPYQLPPGPAQLPPNAPLPPAPAPAPAPVTVGGEVAAASCLACPTPAYPAFARQARIQGAVELAAIIGADGTIASARQIAGNPVLGAAALRAVRAWRYRPLLLDARAVPVATTITIHFSLDPP